MKLSIVNGVYYAPQQGCKKILGNRTFFGAESPAIASRSFNVLSTEREVIWGYL